MDIGLSLLAVVQSGAAGTLVRGALSPQEYEVARPGLYLLFSSWWYWTSFHVVWDHLSWKEKKCFGGFFCLFVSEDGVSLCSPSCPEVAL